MKHAFPGASGRPIDLRRVDLDELVTETAMPVREGAGLEGKHRLATKVRTRRCRKKRNASFFRFLLISAGDLGEDTLEIRGFLAKTFGGDQ